ncbi:hypothetical protein SRHO_G00305450 [Serrasalmus rhombeus]
MAINYTAVQLLKLNTHSTPSCISTIKQLGLLRRPRYIHRSCGRKFKLLQSSQAIPSLWSTLRAVARPTRHQNATALRTSSVGVSMTTAVTEQTGKRGVDFSVLRPLRPPQRHISPSTIKVELFNVQSLTNKSCLIQDHISDRGLDLMCLTETWHRPEAFSVLNEACPSGYSYLQKARSTGRGGGLTVIYRSDLKLSLLPLPHLSSCECVAFKCNSSSPVTFLLIYRPPKLNSSFIPEMSNLLSIFCPTSANIIILGDMNIHVNTSSCRFAAQFLQLLDCFNLSQLIDVPTHVRGHTLDLVITGSSVVTNLSVYDLGVSDHKVVSMEIPQSVSFTQSKREISFRNLKNINQECMIKDLQHLLQANPSSANDAVDLYNRTLSSVLDYHAPVKSRVVTFSRSAPWFSENLRRMKTAGRVLERRYKASGLTVHRIAYREHQKSYSSVVIPLIPHLTGKTNAALTPPAHSATKAAYISQEISQEIKASEEIFSSFQGFHT